MRFPLSWSAPGCARSCMHPAGTENPLNYVVLFVSILCMSLFFSIHYLTIYYLLQPYNAGTEMKSGMYQVILFVTYLVCFFLMQVRLPILDAALDCRGLFGCGMHSCVSVRAEDIQAEDVRKEAL